MLPRSSGSVVSHASETRSTRMLTAVKQLLFCFFCCYYLTTLSSTLDQVSLHKTLSATMTVMITTYTADLQKRKNFFAESLNRLQRKSSTMEALMCQCAEELELYQQNYPDVFISREPHVGAQLPVDAYSLSIYPKKDNFNLVGYTPVYCFGDGNCLFRYV